MGRKFAETNSVKHSLGRELRREQA